MKTIVQNLIRIICISSACLTELFSPMAEAHPAIVAEPESSSCDSPISALLSSTKWQIDTLRMSTINRSLVNNLRLIDPEVKKIKITCAVVEEKGKISEDQLKDAEEHGVQLKGAKQPRGAKKKPEIKWLDEPAAKYYHHLLKDNSYDFIVGHAPYLANGCFNFTDICEIHSNPPKVILVVHGLPKTLEDDVDEDQLLDWLKEADYNLKLHLTSNLWNLRTDQFTRCTFQPILWNCSTFIETPLKKIKYKALKISL